MSYILWFLIDYVDEVFGGESAWPTDPYLKAVDRLFVNDFGNDVSHQSCLAYTYMWPEE